jgi:hypothetical protein
MTLSQYIIKWNNAWRYDYWWRQKYNVPFNSERHRNARQIDIALEYFEDRLSQKAISNFEDDKSKREEYKKTGQWIKIDEKKQADLISKIDISQF